MDIDTLKEQWVEHDRKLDESIRLNRRFLMAVTMNRVRSPLRRFAILSGIAACTGIVWLAILGRFLYEHLAEPRFALPAAVLHIWMVAMVAASLRQMTMAMRIDYEKPVAAIQKQLEALRELRIRVTQWALLTGQVVWWTPFLIVALKGLLDLDAYRIAGPAYLFANVAIGLAIIPLVIWGSRKYRGRMANSPWVEWLMNAVAGHNLNASVRFLSAISQFEKETRDS